ncbi:MAG: hypothetical protein NTX06_10070 [Proteobacteria bacterium]|nr:hypothetical protein [Pseudomonadota bacterium]
MQFLRKIIHSDDIEKGIKLPRSMKHKNVELLIIPVEEQTAKSQIGFDPDSFAGSLKVKNLDKELTMIRNEWERR